MARFLVAAGARPAPPQSGGTQASAAPAARRLLREDPTRGSAQWREAVVRAARKGDLARADLTGEDLTGANLPNVDLRRAHLTGANLVGANLRGANLAGAHLTARTWPARS